MENLDTEADISSEDFSTPVTNSDDTGEQNVSASVVDDVSMDGNQDNKNVHNISVEDQESSQGQQDDSDGAMLRQLLSKKDNKSAEGQDDSMSSDNTTSGKRKIDQVDCGEWDNFSFFF